jgi:tripartite-type tricarboxylate transporter receptor subunit TctC
MVAALFLSALPAQAEPIEDFYRGKTLRMLIGYGPGGGYDIYGRLVAEFLPRHLPGKPTIIAQNMPGAGSFAAASYIHDVAPKDGTVFGSLAQTLALDSMTNTNAKIDVGKMPYIGRVVTNIDVGAALAKTGIKSFEDVRAKQYNVGASGGGSTTVLFPTALNTYGGAKFKLIAVIAARSTSCSRWKEARSISSELTAFPEFWSAILDGCIRVKRRSFTSASLKRHRPAGKRASTSGARAI